MIEMDTLQAALQPIADGRISGVTANERGVTVVLDVAGLDSEARSQLNNAVCDRTKELTDGAPVRVLETMERITPTLIAVASGKGGVGKSTLSANLAVAMARVGRKVGLVDADIYGPSQPRLLAREGVKPTAKGNKLVPLMGIGGVPFLSMGQLTKDGQAIAWRGPMAGQALGQLVDAVWGPVREIIVDMPPGTGDIQLSMVQKHKPAGAVIISTPQDLALIDATRAINFFDTAKVPVIGLVENMAGYLCPHCGEVSEPFGHGGAEAAAAKLGIPFLGRIPLDIAIRTASDEGDPPALHDTPIGNAFAAIAAKVGNWIDSQRGAG